MGLTATTTFDLVDQTQTITFNNPTMIDQITFSNNQFTFETTSGFNLSKSDSLLYNQYLQVFFNLLNTNFPALVNLYKNALPLCQFDITESNVGIFKIIYTQNSQSNNVYTINYLPLEFQAGFAARTSITISPQEFYTLCLFLSVFSNQIYQN